jgi:hypothetical protein
MSIKRQISHKLRTVAVAFQSDLLPAWIFSPVMRLGFCAIIVSFGAAYVVNITASATSGYQMRLLEKQVSALELDVRKLEVEIADNTSMSSIASRVQKTQMTEVADVKFLAGTNGAVAKK